MSSSVFSALTIWIALAGTAAAQTFTLSGTVTGGGSPISGATVEALNNGTTTAAGSSATNAAGQFAIALAPAIYDLRVTPPAASGYGVEVLQDVDLTAGNQQVDVILLASSATVSGTVRGLNGAPISAANVFVYRYPGFVFQGNVQTNASGFYSIGVNASTVYIEVSRSGPSSTAPSSSWYVTRTNVPAGVIDFDLPVATVTGTVTDAGGNPVVNGTVTASGSHSTSATSWSYSSVAGTNATGAYSLLAFTSNATDFTVRPVNGSSLPTLIERNVVVAGDITKNFALPSAATLQGTVRGVGAQAVPSVTVTARSPVTGAILATATTATDGSYTLSVPPGNVNLTFNRSGPSGIAPSSSWTVNRNNFAVSGSTIFDMDLPVAVVTGATTDSASTPIVNASITADSFGSDAQGSWSANASAATSAPGGGHSLVLFRGTANFTVRPPAGTTSATLVDRNVSLSGDVVRNFVLPAAHILTGSVLGIGGQPVAGANVSAAHASGVTIATSTTDANGNYTLPVPAGTLGFVTFQRGAFSAAAPNSWTYRRFNVAVAGPTTLDVVLNVIRLNGSAVDSNGSPVPNVNIQANPFKPQATGDPIELFSSASVNTGSAGTYTMLLLTGTGQVTIRPPTNSGFSQATLNPVTFANNFAQRIVLQRPDTTAPVIVSGPAVLHLSDTSISVGWTTNEPATSFVDYGIGGLSQQAGSSALVTQHTVTLQNLTPNEIYSFRVLSRDRNNNGPTQSATDTFTMLPPPGDVTPPSITGGPLATFLGHTAAIVQWLTNEPASSVVRYGTTAALGTEIASGPGEFLALHAVVLPGLTPSTDYFAQVESTDPDGNTTVSSTMTFRTADAPDIQAPVITAAPTVSSRTHNAATIRWTTDEAATSGVSYNDGSVFNVVGDDSLTTSHEIILAGLSPAKTYSFTVASRDAGGNGPTLSGPFTFTTLAAPDVAPPVISDVSVTPTKNTAAVGWTTDEPGSTAVRFGIASGTLNQTVSNLVLLTSHQVTLTGLVPGTTYFYSLRSTDASGNTTNTPEASFTTLPEDVNTPPTAPGPVTASPNPSRTGAFSINWGASTDDGPGGVKEYAVLRGETVVETLAPTATSYAASGVAEGSHTYRIRASDFSDATSISDPVTVVVDLTAPTLNLPSPITTPATTNTDALVNYTVGATDNIDPNPVVTCTPPSGAAFPIGTTTVPCSARDAAGNVTPGSFTVTVTDPFAPVLTVPAGLSLQAENQNGAVVSFTVTATDNHDPNPAISCSPPSGSVFPVGITLVICTATDASNNTATRSFNVSIGAPPKVASTIALQSSSAASTFGEPITFTATVTGTNGSTPTGVVQFLDGTTVIGQATLGTSAPVTASLTIATLGAGTRSITASYAGDFGHETSTSSAVALEVEKALPTITVGGGPFIFDATPRAATGTVSGVDGGSIGTLSFSYDGSPDAPMNAGTYAVVGSFAGNDNYEAGSANATLTIAPGPTATVVQPGAAIVFGQPATIGAAVSSPTGIAPQGSVEFFDGVTSLGSVVLNATGAAQLVAPGLAAGSHAISAVYSGGGNFAGSVSAAAALEVARASTATSLTIVPNPAGLLEAFKVTATIAVVAPGSGVPTGVVEFFAGATPLGGGTLTLVGGVPTATVGMNGFPSGTYAITARYTGNPSFAPSTSDAVNQVVRVAENSTWTVLTVSPTPSSRANTNVTLRATVVPLGGTVQPTGMVQFYAWSTPIGAPVALANVNGTMTATLVTPALPSGLLQLRALYLGTPGFSTSLSTPVSHTVYATTAPFATTVTMALSGNPIAFGSALTVTVTVASGTRPTPGYVLLFVDGVPTQALPVVSGSPAAFTIPSLGRGLHGITVQFVPSTTTLAGSLAHSLVFVQ